jgi:hypothetical protein
MAKTSFSSIILAWRSIINATRPFRRKQQQIKTVYPHSRISGTVTAYESSVVSSVNTQSFCNSSDIFRESFPIDFEMEQPLLKELTDLAFEAASAPNISCTAPSFENSTLAPPDLQDHNRTLIPNGIAHPVWTYRLLNVLRPRTDSTAAAAAAGEDSAVWGDSNIFAGTVLLVGAACLLRVACSEYRSYRRRVRDAAVGAGGRKPTRGSAFSLVEYAQYRCGARTRGRCRAGEGRTAESSF